MSVFLKKCMDISLDNESVCLQHDYIMLLLSYKRIILVAEACKPLCLTVLWHIREANAQN